MNRREYGGMILNYLIVYWQNKVETAIVFMAESYTILRAIKHMYITVMEPYFVLYVCVTLNHHLRKEVVGLK